MSIVQRLTLVSGCHHAGQTVDFQTDGYSLVLDCGLRQIWSRFASIHCLPEYCNAMQIHPNDSMWILDNTLCSRIICCVGFQKGVSEIEVNSSHCDLGATANTLFVLIFYIISNLSFSGTLCWKKPAIQQSISSAINCKLILCGNEASSGLWSPLAWVEPQRGSHQNLSFWPNTPLLPSSLLSSSDLVSFHTQSWFSSRLLKLSLV